MKSCFPLLLFCLSSIRAFPQVEDERLQKMYLQLGFGTAAHSLVSGEFAVQALFKNKWIATASWQKIIQEPGNLPENYQPAVTLFIIVDEPPEVEKNFFSITGGRYFNLGTDRSAWLAAEGGISLVTGQKLTFTQQPVQSVYIASSSNYNVVTTTKTAIGCMLKTDFNWALSRSVGLGAGFFANISSISSPVGFHIKLLWGWMNRQRDERGY